MTGADAADRLLVRAVGLAVCGHEVEPQGARGERTPAGFVVDALAASGWDAPRLQGLRRARQEDEQPWPLTVDRSVLAAVGFARFHAVLAGVRELLGLDGLVPTRHVGPKVIGPAEQRLLAEVPPHHGNVG